MCQSTIDDVAMFFDFENISISLRKQSGQKPDFKRIIAWFSRFGRVVLARAYADWSNQNSLLMPLEASGFSPVFVPTHANGGSKPAKNAVDMQIAVEATAALYTHPNIKVFGLLTGDKDYLPLVRQLRSQGKKVIALAVQDSASTLLSDAVDEIFFYREMMALPDGRFYEPTKPVPSIYKTLCQAVKDLQAAGKEPLMERIKPRMQQILPGFDEKAYQRADGTPFTRFLEFVEEAQRWGVLCLVRKADGYVVELSNTFDHKRISDTLDGKTDSPSATMLN